MATDPTKYFQNPLQYNFELVTPDSKESFPELNKDLSITNLDKHKQYIILKKGRVADYIAMIFANCKSEQGEKFIPKSYASFIRDVSAMAVSSQALNGFLLKQLTTQSISQTHDYSMNKEYKKNIGGV